MGNSLAIEFLGQEWISFLIYTWHFNFSKRTDVLPHLSFSTFTPTYLSRKVLHLQVWIVMILQSSSFSFDPPKLWQYYWLVFPFSGKLIWKFFEVETNKSFQYLISWKHSQNINNTAWLGKGTSIQISVCCSWGFYLYPGWPCTLSVAFWATGKGPTWFTASKVWTVRLFKERKTVASCSLTLVQI